MLILRAKRLHLRDFIEADWPAVHAFRTDPEVAQFMDFESETEVETQEWLTDVIFHNQTRPRRVYNLAVVLNEPETVVGWIGMGPPSRPSKPGEYDFGYCLNRDYWGQGYMTEAVKRLLMFTFNNLGARRVFAECDPANLASARVMMKAGLQFEGQFHAPDCPEGVETCLRYALSDHAWQQLTSGEVME
jgi:RimJ/RimL family protein N-acetyltransferase